MVAPPVENRGCPICRRLHALEELGLGYYSWLYRGLGQES
jgi:hypothetical protein